MVRWSRDSSVGIATRYGLDGLRFESWWGRDFPHPYKLVGTGSLPGGGVKRSVRGVDHPPHLAPRLKKEWSHTCTPPLGLCGLIYGDFCLYLLDRVKIG